MTIGKLNTAIPFDRTKILEDLKKASDAIVLPEELPTDTDISEGRTARVGGRVVSTPNRNPVLPSVEARNLRLNADLAARHGTVSQEIARLIGAARKDVPARDLEDHECRRLSQRRLSPRESRRLYQDVGQTALAMRREFMAARNYPMARIALSIERLTRRSSARPSLLDARTLLDVIERLPRAEVPKDSAVTESTALLDAPADAMITEFYVRFEHDMLRMRGPDFEPSGFRIFFCTQPPTGDKEADLAAVTKVVDVGVNDERLLHDPEPNTYDIHVAEVDSDLDPTVAYYVWATAYNADEESVNSEDITATLPAAQRGDLDKDGGLDLGDVDLMLGILLDGKLPRVIADLNMDGENTQADLDLLVDAINGG